MNDAIKMQISAFVDGELPQNETELLLRRLCQDSELRQQAAEYLAMGRALRGERAVTGLATLRDRIHAELDDSAVTSVDADQAERPSRYMRPIAGGAIAAAVALAALVGLQQFNASRDIDAVTDPGTIAATGEQGYTVPELDDDLLRDYYLRHNASSSYIGANSINARLVTLQLRDGVVVEHEAGGNDDAVADDAVADEPEADEKGQAQ